MLPWGTDQTWGEHTQFDGAAGVLFDGCLADSSCEATYRTAAGEALSAIAALDLDAMARCVAARLAPWQALESAPMKQATAGQIAASVAATRDFIAARPAELADWLGVAAPAAPAPGTPCPPYPREEFLPQPDPDPEPEPDPTPILPGTPGSPLSVAASPALDPAARLASAAVKGTTLTAQLEIPGAGGAWLRAWAQTRDGRLSACQGKAEGDAAGPLALRCHLGEAVRRRLETHRLKLRLDVRFTPAAGAVQSLSATVAAARIGVTGRRHRAS